MRVLFTTTSGRGHFQPMFPLARALERAGHELRWACAPQVCPELHDRGFDARPAGLYELAPSPLRDPPPEIAALPPAQRPDHLFQLVFGPRRAEAMLVDLLPIAAEWHPHLLVCEQAELAGPIAAARLGVPNVTHAFGRLLPAARVRAALERAVGDTAFRTAAQRAQAEISAMPSPDAVVAELERRYAA